MNKYCFLLVLILSTFEVFSSGVKERELPNMLLRSNIDKSLSKNEAVFVFYFYANSLGSQEVQYSIDGNSNSIISKGEGSDSLVLKTTPGEHNFQFYFNSNFYEVYLNKINIESQMVDVYAIQFESSRFETMTEKPVIYLYSEENIECRIDLDVKGKNPFFYPSYDNGWTVKTNKEGQLTVNDKSYNYLFWEATSSLSKLSKENQTGFFVEGENIVEFLEDRLTEAGLTSSEQADFITYWAPKMISNSLNFVKFEFNEVCDKYAELSISPEPDHIFRIYMSWTSLTEKFPIKDQKMKKMKREGLTVLEWGGQKIQFKNQNSLIHTK